MSVKINEGTATPIKTDTVGTVQAQVIRLDVGSGTTASDFGGTLAEVSSIANVVKGTVTSVENVVKGTVTKLEGGTVAVDRFTYPHPDRFATTVSSGTSVMGTIKAAVAGSVIVVTDLVISAGTATNVEIGDGGTANPLVGTLHFTDLGGMVDNCNIPYETSSGSALVYKQSTDGPLTITAKGYVR